MIKNLVAKLKKIENLPKWAQVLISIGLCVLAIASAFFASMYSYFREITPVYLKSMFESTANSSAVGALYAGSLNYNTLWVLSIISATLFTWAIFELISNIIYKNLKARRQIDADPKFFRMVMRMGFVACNLIYGLFSMLYFFNWSDLVITIGSTVVYMLIYLAVYTLVFLIFSESILTQKTVAAAYKRLMHFFCIVLGVASAYNVLITVLSQELNISELICAITEILIVVGYYCIGRFVIYPNLLKKQESFVEVKTVKNNQSSDTTGGFDFDSYFNSAAGANRNPFANEHPFAGSESDVNNSSSEHRSDEKHDKNDDDEIFTGFGF